jgi:hypothetical protein
LLKRSIRFTTRWVNATIVEVGFVFNFGPKATFKRRILTYDQKPQLKQNP